jgi:hypothetical protein
MTSFVERKVWNGVPAAWQHVCVLPSAFPLNTLFSYAYCLKYVMNWSVDCLLKGEAMVGTFTHSVIVYPWMIHSHCGIFFY